jgi:hypothetical protein
MNQAVTAVIGQFSGFPLPHNKACASMTGTIDSAAVATITFTPRAPGSASTYCKADTTNCSLTPSV